MTSLKGVEDDGSNVAQPILHHYNIANTEEYLEKYKRELLGIGNIDQKATEVFRRQEAYRSNEYTNSTGARVCNVTTLIDPEEFVVSVTTIGEYTRLYQEISNLNAVLARNGISNRTQFEVIYGDMRFPEHCFRGLLYSMEVEEGGNVAVLTIQKNVEHEKDENHFNTDFSEEGILRGVRTGELVVHQRSPQGMTSFGESIELRANFGEYKLFLVGADPDLVAEYRRATWPSYRRENTGEKKKPGLFVEILKALGLRR